VEEEEEPETEEEATSRIMSELGDKYDRDSAQVSEVKVSKYETETPPRCQK